MERNYVTVAVCIVVLCGVALRKYGVPSIRSDLPAPRVRRVDDWTNYGDTPGMWALINPSVFSQHGVYERDVLEPRSRQEVRWSLSANSHTQWCRQGGMGKLPP